MRNDPVCRRLTARMRIERSPSTTSRQGAKRDIASQVQQRFCAEQKPSDQVKFRNFVTPSIEGADQK